MRPRPRLTRLAIGWRHVGEHVLELRRDDLRAEVAAGEFQSRLASTLELSLVGEDVAKRDWKPLRVGGVNHPARTGLAHDPGDLGAGVHARQYGDAARHEVHELRRQVELVDVGPLRYQSDGRPLQLALELFEEQAGHLDAVGADLRRHGPTELAGPREDQPNVIAEGRRALERLHQRGKVLRETHVPHVQDARRTTAVVPGATFSQAARVGVVDVRDLPRRHALGKQVLAECVRDHDDPVRGVIDEPLEVLGRAERPPLAQEPGRGGGVGKDVLEPEDPGESSKAGAGQHRKQTKERRRDCHRGVRGRGKRGRRRRGCRVGRLLHDSFPRCPVADDEGEAEDRDAVPRLSVGADATTPKGARVVRMRGDHLHLVPALAHRLRPPSCDGTHRRGFWLVVPAP